MLSFKTLSRENTMTIGTDTSHSRRRDIRRYTDACRSQPQQSSSLGISRCSRPAKSSMEQYGDRVLHTQARLLRGRPSDAVSKPISRSLQSNSPNILLCTPWTHPAISSSLKTATKFRTANMGLLMIATALAASATAPPFPAKPPTKTSSPTSSTAAACRATSAPSPT
jgi:hypothetical protein